MKIFRNTLCLSMIVCITFFFVGCINLVQDENGKTQLIDKALDKFVYVSKGDGSETGENAYYMVNQFSFKILEGIYNEYGYSLNVVSRSEEDTHLNALYQDSWLWAGNWLYGNDGSIIYDLENLINNEIIAFLNYQIFQVLLGEPVLNFTPNDFVGNDEYLSLKNAGTFEYNNLLLLAKKLDHVGFFYYEVDNIAEFILNNVIGLNAVSKDNKKFLDSNSNGTFDYVENINSVSGLTKNIIKSYHNHNIRKEEIKRNDIWSSIEWGVLDSAPNLEETNKSLQNERAKNINDLKVFEFAYGNDIENNPKFSGFKNYVNTIFFICYNSMINFKVMVKNEEGQEVYTEIPNVLTMTHTPNIQKDVYTVEQTIWNEELQKIDIPCKNYKSILLTAKQLAKISLFNFCFYTDSEKDVELKINLRYHFTNDGYREYIGPYNGESKTVVGNVGEVRFNKNEPLLYTINLAIDKKFVDDAKDMGWSSVTEENITEMSEKGVNFLVLNSYFKLGNISTSFWWNIYEGYTAVPNLNNFKGSSFNFKNDEADFVEIVFETNNSESNSLDFGIGFMWI